MAGPRQDKPDRHRAPQRGASLAVCRPRLEAGARDWASISIFITVARCATGLPGNYGLPTVIDLYMLHDDGLRSATTELGEGQRALLVGLHQPRGRIREPSDLDQRLALPLPVEAAHSLDLQIGPTRQSKRQRMCSRQLVHHRFLNTGLRSDTFLHVNGEFVRSGFARKSKPLVISERTDLGGAATRWFSRYGDELALVGHDGLVRFGIEIGQGRSFHAVSITESLDCPPVLLCVVPQDCRVVEKPMCLLWRLDLNRRLDRFL